MISQFYAQRTLEINLTDSLVERFHKKVIIPNSDEDSCWGWSGTTSRGYPLLMSSRSDGRRKHILGHRLSYLIHKGNLILGMLICHKCDNPICTNPAHLFQGTPKDNNVDTVVKGRRREASDVDFIIRNRNIINALKGGATQHSVAKEFAVSQSTVAILKSRFIGKRIRKVSDDEVIAIYKRVHSGESKKSLADEFCISINTVGGIKTGRNYSVLKSLVGG